MLDTKQSVVQPSFCRNVTGNALKSLIQHLDNELDQLLFSMPTLYFKMSEANNS